MLEQISVYHNLVSPETSLLTKGSQSVFQYHLTFSFLSLYVYNAML